MVPRTSVKVPDDMTTNPFYNQPIYVGKGGYYKNNKNYQCVNYAIGRTTELANKAVCYFDGYSKRADIEKPMFNRSGYGDAVHWLRDTLWKIGTTPKVGAVMVYGASYGSGYGHVRVVEKIDGNRLFISGGNENKAMAFKWINIPSITSTGFMGYIYNPYIGDDMELVKITKDPEYEYVFSVDGNQYGDKYDITTQNGFSDEDLVAKGYELVLKINGSLFYSYENAHYACGLEKSRGINNQNVGMTAVSDYNSCMAIAGIGEDLYFGSQQWVIERALDDAYCAITGLGLILGGKKRNDLHAGFESQWKAISGRTVIGEDEQGNIMCLSFPGETGKSGMTCAQLQDRCLELGFWNALCLDGGGSVFRWYNGKYDISSSRKVKNALLLYRKKRGTAEVPAINYEELYTAAVQLNNDLTERNTQLEAQLNQAQEHLAAAEDNINTLTDKINRIKEIL